MMNIFSQAAQKLNDGSPETKRCRAALESISKLLEGHDISQLSEVEMSVTSPRNGVAVRMTYLGGQDRDSFLAETRSIGLVIGVTLKEIPPERLEKESNRCWGVEGSRYLNNGELCSFTILGNT